MLRALTRATGSFQLDGQFVAAFGNPGTDGTPNPFWVDPRLLTTPLFKTIETGPDLVKRLAGKDGALATPSEPKAGERDAIERLTGTMFGPAVPTDFSWTSEGLKSILSPKKLGELPEGWEALWERIVELKVAENYDGDLDAFRAADPVDQSSVWYDFFDAVVVNEPPRQTSVMVTLTEPARRNLGRVIGRGMLGQAPGRMFDIGEECGISAPPAPTTAPPPFSWLAAAPVVDEPVIHIGGPPVDNVAIDEEGTITLVRLIGYSLALGLGLSLVLLRSWRLMLMVFFVGGVSALAALSMVWWCNAAVDAVLLTMPSLVYVLGIAGAIHIVNYYRDATITHGQEGAPERAIAQAVMPCTLAAVTTAIGLLSLCSSNILPIRKFGIFSAMGVMATLVLLYLYLPSALTIFPPKAKAIKGAGQQAAQGLLNFWEAIGRFILRRHWWVNAVCIALFISLGLGLFKIKTSVQLLKLFDSHSQIVRDYAWLEENFGRLVPMELVVRFPTSMQRPIDDTGDEELRRRSRAQLSLLERAEAVSKIQEVLQDEFGYSGQDIVGRGMSAVTLIKDMPEPWSGTHPFRSAYNRKLHQKFEELLETDFLAIEESDLAKGTELWRISLRLGALNDVDYGEFVSTLRAAVEPVVAAYICRQRVIETIVAQHSEFDERTVGSVVVLGAGRPQHGDQAADGRRHAAQQTSADEGQAADIPPVNGKAIFTEALAHCFINETVKPRPGWHDPDEFPLTDEGNREKLLSWLDNADCVVLLEDHADYDLEEIRQHNPNLVDARDLLSMIESDSAPEVPKGTPVELSTQEGAMDVVYTGVVPVVYKAQNTLLVSLIESVVWAFALIAIVMICLLSPARSFWSAFTPRNALQAIGSGAISMVPNIFPVVIIFGFMGHCNTLVDIGSMMTASVAMGVAVDDTIHFLTWFRDGLRRGMDRRDAILAAYKHVAPAMTQTTIIGGLGLSVFALSTFTPTQRFGTLMLALLGAALVGDLIFLPALLASPLGRVFGVRPKNPKQLDSGSANGRGQSSGANVDEYHLADEQPCVASEGPMISASLEVPAPQMLRRAKSSPHKRL